MKVSKEARGVRISGIIWLDDVLEKLEQKHDVRQGEAREVLASGPMSEGKSTISQASSYKEIGDFWDTHDLADYWDQTEPAEFEVNLEAEVTYYALDKELSQMLSEVAEERGVSAETLLNLWVQEKLWKHASPETA